jgi:citrate/tricarballylate utilization protein
MPVLDLFQEANRQLTICNSCRYCEGYCPVFRAIETRRDFASGDVQYLANLCHDCRACYYACMYAPPHEFAINIPKILADARTESYRRWSWPEFLSRALAHRFVEAALAFLAWAAVVLLSVTITGKDRMFTRHLGPGAFYQVIPYVALVVGGMALFFYWACVWIIGGLRFWSEANNDAPRLSSLATVAGAIADALSLNYLKGGGPGCYYPGDRPSSVRRIYHSLTAWGFLSALISTSLAAIYQDVFRWLPPFRLTSAPVLFGTAGGVAMTIGTLGLIWFKLKSDHVPAGSAAPTMDYTFLVMLCLTSLSGLFTLVFRAASAMGTVLVIHLGFVAALFITAPYGKFIHVVYRFLALVKYRTESGGPSRF